MSDEKKLLKDFDDEDIIDEVRRRDLEDEFEQEATLDDFSESQIRDYYETFIHSGSDVESRSESLFQKLITGGWTDEAKRLVEDWIYEDIGRTV